MPGVAEVEVWSSGRATRVRPDDSKSSVANVVAVPVDTTFMDPELVAGRWLPNPALGTQPNSVVINSDLADDERDLHVGSEVVLDISGRKATWHVVGIVSTELRGPAVYVSRDDFGYATRTPGEGMYVQVRMAQPGASRMQRRSRMPVLRNICWPHGCMIISRRSG